MRKFLTGVLTTAVFLLASGVAFAGNAKPENKWMTEIPDSDEMIAVNDTAITARFARDQGTGQSVKRHQKVYMAFFDDDGDVHVNQDGKVATCTENDSCTSAPLFIASETALICVDGDIGASGAVGGNTIHVRICADSTCTSAKSFGWGSNLAEGPTTGCGVGGQKAGAAQPSIGGQYIYIDLIGAPNNGDEVLVWVVGQ